MVGNTLLPRFRASFRSAFVQMVAGLSLLGLAVLVLASLSLLQSKHNHEERATTNAKNLAQLIAHDIVATINAADRALLTVATEYQDRTQAGFIPKASMNKFIEQQKAWRPELSGVRVVNAQGDVVQGTGAGLISGRGLNVASRDYFKKLKYQNDNELVISEPIKGRISEANMIVFSRSIRNRDGSFGGAVTASVALTQFAKAITRLALGANGTYIFFDDNARIITRVPELSGQNEEPGLILSAPPVLELLRTHQAEGAYQITASHDKIERIYAFRSIVKTPFNLSVGLASVDYLAPWQEEVFKTGLLVLALILVILLLIGVLYRALKNQEKAFDELRQLTLNLNAEKHLTATIVQSSPFAIYTRDTQGIVTAWNTAAEKLFGWRAEEIIGRPLGSVPPDKLHETEELRTRVLGGETLLQREVERIKKDGTRFDLSTTMAPLRGANGEIDGYLAIATDVTERKAAEKRIEFLAYRDVLTGLPNRLLVQDRFEQALTYAERNGQKVALLFLDLDNFKTINDSLGHTMGDALLKEVAKRLEQCVRETDTISRQGGDEFLIVLPDLRASDAITPILVKIREQLQLPFEFDENELSTSVSIGIALYPEDGRDFDTLLKKADTAMYRAKDEGRNGYRFFDEQMNIEAVDHLHLKNGLRRAISKGEFVLHYQPQIDLVTNAVIGAEALIRWNHPDQGMVSPARFIALAEDSGLIVPIGDWVMHEACRQAVAWRAAGLPPLVMGVNLSAVQFKRGDVEQTVRHALSQSGLDPHCLELELTESILIHNTDQVLASVKQLKLLGVKLSIDDFGTGYSSLSYLKRFDVDKLKIDQSFIRDLATDPDDEAIIFAIVQMARSLNLRTIAEGVETAEMLSRLKQFRCDEAQGYYFARPMTADAFAEFLASHKQKLQASVPK